MGYQKCSNCGKFHDDGGLRGVKFVCHDCLDQANVNNKGSTMDREGKGK